MFTSAMKAASKLDALLKRSAAGGAALGCTTLLAAACYRALFQAP
jgi:hypothetical protein